MTDLPADIAAIARIDAVPTILEVVCRTTGMGFAAVARVTEDRWVACGVRDEIAFGLEPGGELQIETTICNEIRDSRQAVIIDNVAADPTFCQHHTPARYGFQSYISMPIVLADGSFFGTLCAIDPTPHKLNTPATIGMFKLFAELIAFHLDAHRRISASEVSLASERHTAELREQFIAVLGHDLRNPLASIEAGARLAIRTGVNDKARSILELMQKSAWRMSALINDVLDLARGRMGGGLIVERTATEELTPALRQVVEELRSAHPERSIEADLQVSGRVRCDIGRIGQLLSNLLGNALMHGDAATPVRVRAETLPGTFVLEVSNAGPPIPPEVASELFKPFVRASAKPDHAGLGLGLYISSEIAKAHAGTLDVSSVDGVTSFVFKMPI
ncbi:GAF domain-containing protein [Bosea caraganae]|uniref:histidine kinase n=1 Tax=Bosea caraganae TaxID=2763117 RepID=A0A370L4G3_9HYPH|nr:GAF domain-containing sensor histidine kinase [Bosea caraganae]RDJ22344.1 GAF domain-containing protein [Bosea caraganae]RDJ23722.1 GAF domain-containing protein [Bosea caraganae]